MERSRGVLRSLAIILVICLTLSSSNAFSREADSHFSRPVIKGLPSSIQTPQDLSHWLSKEFQYIFEITDRWQTPENTIASRVGDCEDFALLSSKYLSQMGISNDIIIVKFHDLELSHAICIWKNQSGAYNFFSNRELVRTGKGNIEDAIERFYPDWDKIIFTDHKKSYKKTIRRKS